MSTRRGFLGGLGALLAAPVVAPPLDKAFAAPIAPEAACSVTLDVNGYVSSIAIRSDLFLDGTLTAKRIVAGNIGAVQLQIRDAI